MKTASLFFISFVSIFSWVNLARADFDTSVLAIEPLVLRQLDQKVKTYEFTAETVKVRGNAVYLMNVKSRGIVFHSKVRGHNIRDTSFEDTSFLGLKSWSFRVLGKLEKPVSLQIEGSRGVKVLTIPANRTMVFGHENNLKFDVKNDEDGELGIESLGETEKREAIFAKYRQKKEVLSREISELEKTLVTRDYPRARLQYSEINKKEIFSEESAALDELYPSFPPSERPIEMHKQPILFESSENELATEGYGQFDFSTMPFEQVVRVFKLWATTTNTEKPYKKNGMSGLPKLMKDVGVSPEKRKELWMLAIEVRARKLLIQLRDHVKTDDMKRDSGTIDQVIELLHTYHGDAIYPELTAMRDRLLLETKTDLGELLEYMDSVKDGEVGRYLYNFRPFLQIDEYPKKKK